MQKKRLTKKFLFSLPKGKFVVSNLLNPYPEGFRYYEYVPGTYLNREKQWMRIVELSCNGRLCSVFNSKSQAIKYWGVDYVQ